MSRLAIRGLAVSNGTARPLDGVDLRIEAGEMLALVGASGAGKSLTALSVLGLLPEGLRQVAGSVRFNGTDRRPAPGREAGLVFQDPRGSLNPIRPVGRQVADVIARHGGRESLPELLAAVRFPAERAGAYAHELSGGLCQRIGIALALAGGPGLLLADEPTSALDAATRGEVMALLRELTARRGLATLFITHDLGLAARWCERIAVMEAGRVVETGPAAGVLARPHHPATAALAEAARPHPPAPPPVPGQTIIEGTGLTLGYRPRRGFFRRERIGAVEEAGLVLRAGEALGLIGASGSGKSTLARLLARLEMPEAGELCLLGRRIDAAPAAFARHPLRACVQMVFQDATGALNPRWTGARIVADPLRRLRGALPDEAARIRAAARAADLPEALLDRRPAQMSGGQRARLGLARALVVEPCALILDEATSALDAVLEAGILARLDRLRHERGLGLLVITHDMRVVRRLCERVAVMDGGRIVEGGATRTLLAAPRHPATRALVATSG